MLEKENARLLRMVEMVMEQRFYRPAVTGGIRENVQTSALPIEALNDVAVFDEESDAAQINEQGMEFNQALRDIENEHLDWRKRKGLTDAEESSVAAA